MLNGLLLYKQTKDEDFDKEETKFREIEKTVKIFTKDVQTYMDQLQVCFHNSHIPLMICNPNHEC